MAFDQRNCIQTNRNNSQVLTMSDPLTTKNLIICLQEKDKYKGTLTYLQEAHKFNEKVYDIFNQALETVLLSKHNNYMAKLLSLRLFKEIVLTGNFTLIDGLNEKIEEEIVKVVQYNKKSKEINRGANYFIQVEKIKKDADIQKVGSSYVLLASEILMALAKWYPVDEDGVKSRFAEWYEKLVAAGVPFHDFNFFKKEDQEKFKSNYQKWMKWYLDQVREEDVEETAKQIKTEDIAKDRVKQEKKNNQDMKHQAQTKVGAPVQPEVKKELQQNKCGKIEEQTVQRQTKKPIIRDSCQKCKKLEEQINQFKRNMDQITKEKNYLKSKHDKDLTLLKVSKEQTENKLNQANKLCSEYQFKSEKMKQKLDQKDKIILNLESLVSDLKERVVQLEQSKKVNTLAQQQTVTVQEAQCYNIKLTPPREYEQLEEQNDILTQALEKAEEHFLTKKKEFQDSLAFIKDQNKRLTEEIALKTKQLQQQRSKKSVEQELLRNIIRQDSLLIEDQPKMLYKAQPLSNTLNQSRSYSKPAIKNCSVSEYLRANSKMKLSQNIETPAEARPRSLKKTESQHKIKVNKDIQGFSNTGFSNECKAASSKLTKTTSNFNNRLNLEHNNNVVTYFPFLEDYFQPLPDPNPWFKKCCLLLQPEKNQFFENQLIKASITKTSQVAYLLNIFNKASNQLKVKILSEHYSLTVEGERSKKILGGRIGSFTLNFEKFDLNLRYPIVSIVIGNQRISLTNNTLHERNVNLALPLTLLDFCTVYREKEREWISSTKIAKYCSDKLAVGRLSSTLQESLPFFKISYNRHGVVAKGGLELIGRDDARVLIQVQQNQGDFWIGVWFRSDSSNGSNFAKVVMQILLYLIQK